MTATHPDGEDFLDRVKKAGADGLSVPSGPSSDNLSGGLLGLWGLVKSTASDGHTMYRLPPGAKIDLHKELRDAELGKVKADLADAGFARTSFEKMGLSGPNFNFTTHLLHAYYNAGVLRVCEGDKPADRARARAAAYFMNIQRDAVFFGSDARLRRGGGLILGDYPDATVAPRDGDNIEVRVDYPRIRLSDDDSLYVYAAFLASLSEEMFSTIGINLFSVKNHIVEKSHQDNVDICTTAVIEVDGNGAESVLYRNEDGRAGKLVFEERLESGEVLLFKDKSYFHGARHILPKYRGHQPSRKALVVTSEPASKFNWPQHLPRLLAQGS